MSRKAETVVTEENTLHEDDMEMENVPDTEGTGMEPDTLSVDADFSTAEESTETATPAEPLSADEESAGEDTCMEETLPEIGRAHV